MSGVHSSYRTLVFDCDGVVLDSNKAKTQSFYNAAFPYGEEAAQRLVDYHVANGGISRYRKFEVFLKEMVPTGAKGPGLDELLSAYAQEVRAGLLSCAVTDGLEALREQTADARWMIVSGGDQAELREVFAERGLADLFDGGIFGSPDAKDDILKRELAREWVTQPAIFLGDSRFDHVAAIAAGLDFVFVSQWTEFCDWDSYCREHRIPAVRSLADLLSCDMTSIRTWKQSCSKIGLPT